MRELIRVVEGVTGTVPFGWSVDATVRVRADEHRCTKRERCRRRGRRIQGAGAQRLGRGSPAVRGQRSPGLRNHSGWRIDHLVGGHRQGTGRHSDPSRRRASPRGHLYRMERVDRVTPLHGTMVGCGQPQWPRAQAPRSRADRRGRRRRDDLPPGGHRRRTQLGLPLLLAPRFRVHHERASATRLRRTRPKRSSGG